MNRENYLLQLCEEIYRAEERAQAERKREAFGDQFMPELLVMRKDKVRVEIRKENVSHNTPHMHITHSDIIDVSISLIDFTILAGKIDRKTQKHLMTVLMPKKTELNNIWKELNENDSPVDAEKLISNLNL